MDPTAIAHCMEHDLPILVFNYRADGNIERAVRGEDIGTLVTQPSDSEEMINHGDTESTEKSKRMGVRNVSR